MKTMVIMSDSTLMEDGVRGIFLTTFAGLDAARRIYDSAGFVLVHEQHDRTWGTEVMEQRFELVF